MLTRMWKLAIVVPMIFGAYSSSSSYRLQNYGLGSGGTSNAASPSYQLNGSSGDLSSTANGATTNAGTGQTQVQQANVPKAPTVTNGSNTFYNKLQIVINTSGSDASDYTYSIAVSTNGFSTTSYVQADGTIGATAVYQSLATWGGASGSYMVGLTPGVTYAVKVNARQGNFTASAYGPSASAATVNPSLNFSLSPTSVPLGNLNAGVVTTAGSPISIGFATNAVAGGAVYVAGAYGGLKSTAALTTINAVNADLTGQSEGFGLIGSSASQTSGGPFAFASPYNGSGNVVGAETTNFQPLLSSTSPLVGGSGTLNLKGKASTVTPSAGDYSEILTFIASASY